MNLNELLEKANIYYDKSKLINHNVHKISINSKDINKDDIFVALYGNNNDGHQFINEAIEQGCQSIIYEESYYSLTEHPEVNFIKVSDTKKALAMLSSCFYDDSSHKIDLTGVTGTNGKTTITSLIHNIYQLLNIPSTLIGTNGIYLSDKYLPSDNTTPNSLIINKVLNDGIDEGIKHGVMEVSSIAVKEQRIAQIDFDTMIYTNFTLDHLDYHITYDDYFYNKVLAFSYLGNNARNHKLAIINGDDDYAKKFLNFIQVKSFTYGFNEQNDFRARKIVCDLNSISFDFYFRNQYIESFNTSQLFGFFNISNLLAVLSFFYLKSYDMSVLKEKIMKINKVKGRFEKVQTEYPIHAFIDYAHSPDSVKKILEEVKLITKQRVITVIGCGGDRDKTKRPQMAKMATEYSDYTVFTSDNPRSEDPLLIIDDMLKGVVSKAFIVIPDRKQAIQYAISEGTSEDLILILGKGHEEYQLINGIKYYFNDYKEALNAIEMRFMEEK